MNQIDVMYWGYRRSSRTSCDIIFRRREDRLPLVPYTRHLFWCAVKLLEMATLRPALRTFLVITVLFITCSKGDDGTDVLKLTKDNFDDIISKEKLVFVKFFAPWCGHCQAMAEDFKSAATELKGKAVLADVDATVEEELAKKYKVDGFPTLKMFADGELLTDYHGGRDKESIIKFIERATLPSYVEIFDKEVYEKFVSEHDDKNLLIVVEPEEESLIVFKKATFSLRDVMPDAIEFALAKSVDVVSIDGAQKGDIYLLRFQPDGSHTPVKYDVSSGEPIDRFVKTSALPVFQEFTQENAELYTELSIPLVVGFFTGCENDDCKTLEKVALAKADATKIAFAWVNTETLSSFQEYVGLKGAKIPICAYAFESDLRYILPEDFKLTEENLGSWVDDLVTGKVLPARKSQPIPETQDGPVHIVVGDSWSDDVENVDKDVFVAQIAEWCGHCAALKPVLKKVANELKNAGINHVRVAQMDATENDAPEKYKARGFPTVHFFHAGSGKGIEYDGGRSSKEIIEWLKEKSTKKFEFDTDTLGEDPTPEEEEEEEGDMDEGEEDEGEMEKEEDDDDESEEADIEGEEEEEYDGEDEMDDDEEEDYDDDDGAREGEAGENVDADIEEGDDYAYDDTEPADDMESADGTAGDKEEL